MNTGQCTDHSDKRTVSVAQMDAMRCQLERTDHAMTLLREELAAMPAWHARPTVAGWWAYWFPGMRNLCFVKLDAKPETYAPFGDWKFYGPIPEPPP